MSDAPLHRIAQLAMAIRNAAAAASPGWPSLLVLSRVFFDGEIEGRLSIGCSPCRGTEPGELVKVHFNLNDGFAPSQLFVSLLTKELEPFIIGVGEVRAYGTPEGLVLVRRNENEREDDLSVK